MVRSQGLNSTLESYTGQNKPLCCVEFYLREHDNPPVSPSAGSFVDASSFTGQKQLSMAVPPPSGWPWTPPTAHT